MADYPAFVYYPVRSPPSAEATELLQVFKANQAQIDTTQHDPILTKPALIGVLTPTLTAINLPPAVNVQNNALYGRQGAVRYSFTIDLTTSKFSLFIATTNAPEEVCRHLIHMSFLQGIADVESARMAALAVPLRTIHQGNPRQDFEEALALTEALFARSHLSLLSGLLVLGY